MQSKCPEARFCWLGIYSAAFMAQNCTFHNDRVAANLSNLPFRHAVVNWIRVFKVVCFGHLERFSAMRVRLADTRWVSNVTFKIWDHFLRWSWFAVFIIIPVNNRITGLFRHTFNKVDANRTKNVRKMLCTQSTKLGKVVYEMVYNNEWTTGWLTLHNMHTLLKTDYAVNNVV